MKGFVDILISEDLSPIDACYELVEASEELRDGVKTMYRGRWIAANYGDSADRLHKVMMETPPDWPHIITAKG